MLSSFDLLLIGVSLLVMAGGFIARWRMWRQGKPEGYGGSQPLKNIILLLDYFLAHRKILEDRTRGIAHLFIFWGFLVPLIVVIIAQFSPTMPVWSARGISLLLDVLGICAVAGTVMLLFGNLRDAQGPQKRSSVHLWVFLAVLVTGFLAGATRLAITESTRSIADFFSPVELALSYVLPASPIVLKVLIRIHFLLVLFFLAYLPFSIMRHLIPGTLNVYYRNGARRGAIKPMVLEGSYFGSGRVKDLTWRQLLDTDACMDCGRCERNCPAFISGQILSPRGVVQKIRECMEGAYRLADADEHSTENLLEDTGTVGGEDIWSCTSCMACVQSCPVLVDHLDKIIETRRYAVLTESRFPEEYKKVFKHLEVFGDSLGEGSLMREDWALNLSVNKLHENPQGENLEMLLWVGCAGSLYDERSKNMTLAAAKILSKAKVAFGILGKEELCCGDPARRMGNEYLFQRLARQNIEIFQRYGVKKIVTMCPHGFNVFRNEYPQLGADFEVEHITMLINRLLDQGRLTIASKADGIFTYQDPCYLGRYNDIYKEPRNILGSVLCSNIQEMESSREKGFCCGAGGGNFWRGKMVGRRMEEVRIEQAMETKANGVISACPFCKIMLDSAVKQKGMEHAFKVMDIVELVNKVT
jgi:Fe-S oxidoreductase